MMVVVVLLAWISTAGRLWATIRFPSRARWYLTVAIALFAINQTLQLNAATFDRLIHVPNISILIGHIALIAVGAAVLLFFDAYPDRPAALRRRLAPAVMVAVIYTACWVLSPIHDHHLSNMAVTSSNTFHVAVLVSDGYLVIWASIMAKRVVQHAIRRDTDFSRLGLIVIGIGALERALASLSNIVWVMVSSLSDSTEKLMSDSAYSLAYMASFYVVAGAGLSVLDHGVRMVATNRQLGPLWRALTELTPEVVLPLRKRPPGSAIAFRALRRRIEITDSLFHLTVAACEARAIRDAAHPELELGKALRAGKLTTEIDPEGRVLAGRLLPRASTRAAETARLLRMAEGYRGRQAGDRPSVEQRFPGLSETTT